ncbi:MAG: hypothetical protein ACREA2_22330, partial [Blastocatellia bacterium]
RWHLDVNISQSFSLFQGVAKRYEGYYSKTDLDHSKKQLWILMTPPDIDAGDYTLRSSCPEVPRQLI